MIDVNGVSKRYGDKLALDRVSLQALDGLVTGFVGPNGAGKSTLLKVIAKLATADAGHVDIDGSDFALSGHPGSALGVSLSAEWIPVHVTATSFLAHVCDLQGVPHVRAHEMLEVVGLANAKGKRVKTFSLGMRQRLSIAAAGIGRPRNLILDEPFNGLDPEGIQWLRGFATSVAQAGGSVLMSSHHMNELAQVADNMVMIDGGRVVRSGAMASFVAESVPRTYVETHDVGTALNLLRDRGFSAAHQGGGILVTGAEPLEVGRLLFQDGPGAYELRLLERTLEETYFAEVGSSRLVVERVE